MREKYKYVLEKTQIIGFEGNKMYLYYALSVRGGVQNGIYRFC